MSRKFWTLPIRALIEPSARTSATTCRRCLSSQPKSVTAPDIPISPAPRTLKDPEEADNYDPTLPSALRDYRLKSTDFYLKKKLPQAIPPQYLQHSTSEILCPAERAQRDHDRSLQRDIRGVVVSAGKMDKTVRVRVPGRKWNKKIGKYYADQTTHMCHDPNNSLIIGDVITMHRLHASSQVFHVVGEVLAPFGKPLALRPPVPTPDERLAAYKKKRFAKLHRRGLRQRAAKGDAEAIRELQAMGLDAGAGVAAGEGREAVGQVGRAGEHAILGNKGPSIVPQRYIGT